MREAELSIDFNVCEKSEEYHLSQQKYVNKKLSNGFTVIYDPDLAEDHKKIQLEMEKTLVEQVELTKDFGNKEFNIVVHNFAHFSSREKDWVNEWDSFLKILNLTVDRFIKTLEDTKLFVGQLEYRDIVGFQIAKYLEEKAYVSSKDQEKFIDKYYDWYVFKFEYSPENCFRNEEFKKVLNNCRIYNDFWSYDNPNIWMFFQSISPSIIKMAFERYWFLMDIEGQVIKEKEIAVKNYFDKNKSWSFLPK